MINTNGVLTDHNLIRSHLNRGFSYGDALFETIKVLPGKICFWEDHYFRLMASMRILRMEIPMEFTMEFLESEIFKTIKANGLQDKPVKIRLYVNRKKGGLYKPESNLIDFLIMSEPIGSKSYPEPTRPYTVDLYKDFFVAPGLLSTLKTNNKIINVLGSIYADENEWDNCLLLNTEKNVVEALNGNIFLLSGHQLITPPLSDGCLQGIMRKQILRLAKKIDGLQVVERSISPFELQKVDEIFMTNIIAGTQPIYKYRKKEYKANLSAQLLERLNQEIDA